MKKLVQMKTIPMVIIPPRPIPFCSSSQQTLELRRALRGRVDGESPVPQFEQVVAPSGFSEPHLLQNTIVFHLYRISLMFVRSFKLICYN